MKSCDNFHRPAAYYLERAAACERLAAEVSNEESREILRQLAARWRALATEASGSPRDKG